jgi:outer membrane cobalamin receptor
MAAENLFDREYQYQPGYTMAGAGVQLGVSASF